MHAALRIWIAGLVFLAALVPMPAAAQEVPEPSGPDPAAVYKTYLPTLQGGTAFDAGVCPPSAAAKEALPTNGEIVAGQYIVLFKEEAVQAAGGEVATAALAEQAVSAAGGTLLYTYDAALAGFAATLPPSGAEMLRADPRVAEVEPDRYVVLVEPDSGAEVAAPGEAFAKAGAESGATDTAKGAAAGAAVFEALAASAPVSQPEAAEAEAPLEGEGILAPEAQLTTEWGLDRIDQRLLPLNGRFTVSGGRGVHIYVIDTGIRTTHTEFGSRIGAGMTAFPLDGLGTNDCNGHGTHVAATAAGGSYGVARSATVHPVRVLNASGSGTVATVLAGINWVTRYGQRPAVVNMSLGGLPDARIDTAVRNGIRSGYTYVLAAGNDFMPACSTSPARVREAITVGATNSSDFSAGFSNYGPCVDLFAPGVDILSAGHLSDTATEIHDGTSMASPLVAGAAALLLSRTPSMTPAQVTTALQNSATRGRLSLYGAGSPNRMLYVGRAAQPANNCSPVNLVANSGFESGPSRWREESLLGLDLICTQSSCGNSPLFPYRGAWMGWLGGAHNELSVLSQSITVPAGTNALLSVRFAIQSTDICGYDYGNLGLRQGEDVLSGASLSLCRERSTAGWEQVQLNVAAAAGRSVTLYLGATTDDSYISNFLVDEVTLQVGEGCVAP